MPAPMWGYVYYRHLAIPLTRKQTYAVWADSEPTRVDRKKLRAFLKTPPGQRALKRAVLKRTVVTEMR